MKTTIKILLLASISALFNNNVDSGDSNASHIRAQSTIPTLVRARSSDTVETLFKTSLTQQYGTFKALHYSDFLPASNDVAEISAPTTFATTTLQESHVDESDRLKTDGQYIYISSINTPSIKIFKAGSGSASLVAKFPVNTLNSDTLLSGLYLRADKNQLIALAGDTNDGDQSEWFSANDGDEQKTELFTVDVSSPTAPIQRNQLMLDGQLINSRRIGSTLYLATRHKAKIPKLIEYPESAGDAAFNRQLINSATIDDFLPKYQANGLTHDLFDSDECFFTGTQPSHYSQHSVISLLAIDLDAAVPTPKGLCFIGDTETLYASASAIYLATTQYQYPDKSNDIIYKGSPTTEIHKFSLDGTHTEYAGSASINGHLGWQQSQKPFRLSETNGVLRVLSYVGEQADSIESPARLHILKENDNKQSLDVIATLPNESRPTPLGKKGEQIYASRFIGDRGYLVTFRTTDPLYILDLSNPYDPFILSALEVDGYSDYLHPIGEKLLLGIGKNAVTQASDDDSFNTFSGAWAQGVKLSLIDISDPSAPIEKEKIILGKRGTETAVSKTHHALTTVLKGDTLQVNFPLSLHEAEIENYAPNPHPSDYFGWTQDALYRFSIDINSGEISRLEPITAKMDNVPEEDEEYYRNTDWQHDRSTIIDGDTYYLKRDDIFTPTD